MKPDWSRVSLEHVRQACEQYDLGTAVPKRAAKSTYLALNGKTYPAKFIRGRAYYLATGIELDPNKDYAGGQETVKFFERLGLSTRHDLPSVPEESTTPSTPLPPVEEHAKASKEPQKRALAKLLRRYGTVKIEEEFPWLTVPAPGEMDEAIGSIFDALKKMRGFTDFITPGKSLKCDFFIPDAKLIVEYDERQHFTVQRAKALELYRPDLKLAFDREEWITACRMIKATDPDRKYPYRDEQRAFYDTLRDILAVRNGIRLIRLRFGTDDWTGSDVDGRLDAILGAASPSTAPSPMPAVQKSSRSTIKKISKIALVSHDYTLPGDGCRYDYSEHFAKINQHCDKNKCDTILYALYTWDRKVARNHDAFFGGLKHVQRIILEVGQPANWSYDHVEVWQRGDEEPLIAKQQFTRASDSPRCKAQFISDLPGRVVRDSLLVICGESGIVTVNRSGGFTDSFGFLEELNRLNVRLILNPIHDYMRRYEMREKRRYYSLGGRTVISVWNQGKGRESHLPWTVFHDGVERTEDVVKLTEPFSDRTDIRIGIVQLSAL